MKIVIVDYGMGNIKSIVSALKYLGVDDVIVSSSKDDLAEATKLILPGVGSFAQAIQNIKELNLDIILKKLVVEDKKPILGICLGMQLMTESSNEDGVNNGLGFIEAFTQKFSISNLKVPHVGFDQVQKPDNSRLYFGLDNLSDFYFTHSYQVQSDKQINQGKCKYGNEFIVSYEVNNIAGVQFHPELSQTNGLKLLENFIRYF
jgi:glutamine amidotransferase